MATKFKAIPDSFSTENQGGGIAFVDVSGSGQLDLVAFMIDNPPGQNRGLFRIGRKLDETGNVTGGYTPWMDVPDWFSFENQGGGIAVADIDKDGKQDLIVFMIDNPLGQNAGFYRIGHGLDINGNITGGWGQWIQIPDWFSFDNQYGSIGVGDLNGDGSHDLLIGMVDNPAGQNRGLYRIGRKLDANGNVTGGWIPWIEVPDWFSFENQGMGIAAADLDGNGKQDLIIFQIDNAVQQNQAFYKIGHSIDINGNVQHWSLWHSVPGWFAWENQGGGIALSKQAGKLQMAVMMIDNPPGQNTGYYLTLPLDVNPQRDGQWELLDFHSGVVAVHAALLPTGKVLFFAGSGSSQNRFDSPDFGNMAKGIFTSVVWDPQAASPGNFAHPQTIFDAHGKAFDFFCGGDNFLPDGKLISAGGTIGYNPYRGRADATVFDPQTGKWSFIASMTHGRWYPSLIALGDGRVLAATGFTEVFSFQHNQTLEIYNPVNNKWDLHHFPPGFPNLPLYAHLFQLDDGRVFFNGGHMDDVLVLEPCVIDFKHEPIQTTAIFGINARDMRNQSASVILPPVQDQRIMLIGGGPDGKQNKTDAVDNVDIVDFKAAQLHFAAAAPMNLPRLHLNAVLLPDRTVFVTGGSLKQEDVPLAQLQSEIYDPVKNEWTLTASSTVPRLYHSTALLLPDGRVVAAGGNPDATQKVEWDKDPKNEEMRLEVFSPPYLFKGPRPVIGNVPEEWAYGKPIEIQSLNAGSLKWAHLMRPCVTTHSFDSSQRLIDLPINSQAGGTVKITVPTNPNIAPPSWYMLFIVNNNGVPSVAHWVHLT
jgi:Domain of unknown function (DUF1929)/FG-GAP-like repeat